MVTAATLSAVTSNRGAARGKASAARKENAAWDKTCEKAEPPPAVNSLGVIPTRRVNSRLKGVFIFAFGVDVFVDCGASGEEPAICAFFCSGSSSVFSFRSGIIDRSRATDVLLVWAVVVDRVGCGVKTVTRVARNVNSAKSATILRGAEYRSGANIHNPIRSQAAMSMYFAI